MKPYKKPIKRSGLEDKVLADLASRSIGYKYEPFYVHYYKQYIPDLVLDNGIIIEIKGYLDADTQAKHLSIKRDNPELDIRFLFEKPNKKLPHRQSTYEDWCNKNGFKYTIMHIPDEWLLEPQKELKNVHQKINNKKRGSKVAPDQG